MKKYLLIVFILLPAIASGQQKADVVIVNKSEAKLYLMKNKKVMAKFHAAFGAHPKGHKQELGDERTPEGKYVLDYKNANSAYYKSIHISYPNTKDKKHAKDRNVNPGGDIMIHGQKNGYSWLWFITQQFNWTDGCIAVSNYAMDEIWQAVDVGTPIVIEP